MTDSAAKRPPTLAGACIYLGALSAILSIRAMTLVTTWNGDNRAEQLDSWVNGLREAGLGRTGAEDVLKLTLAVIAVVAACGVVFAIFTARGDRASRVGLTITVAVSGVTAFIGVLGGDFLYSMIGALLIVFSARLWTGEIRTYFRTLAGHAPPPPKPDKPDKPAKVPAAADPFARYPAQNSADNGPQAPVPAAEQPVASATQPTAPYGGQQPPPGYAPPGYHQPSWQPRREPFPKPVSIAVWTAFIASIVATGLSALLLLVVVAGGVDYDTIMDQGGAGADMIGSESDFDTAIRFLTVLSSISVVVGLAGLLASIRVLVTRRSGAVPLFIMTVVGLVVSVIGFPLGLPWTAAAIVALVFLRKPESKAWFSRT
ncbi:MAG: hypothetical protein ABW075_01510 [Aeromicrobium sp.]